MNRGVWRIDGDDAGGGDAGAAARVRAHLLLEKPLATSGNAGATMALTLSFRATLALVIHQGSGQGGRDRQANR